MHTSAMQFLSLRKGSAGSRRYNSLLFVERLEERTVPSVTIGVSVDGMNTTNNSCNCQPPDTIVAAGPDHVVEMVNTAIEVFNKSGNVTSAPRSLLSFFSNHINANESDPFVSYDELGGKFVAGVLDFSSGNRANYVDFATGTDSASGITWTLHSPYASGEGRRFLDYPRFGYNADAYFIEGNMFRGGSFTNVQVITIRKTTLAITSRHDDSSLFTLTPAAMHGAATGGPEYFVEASDNGGSSLAVVTETNVLSSSPTFTTSTVSVPAYTTAPAPQQPGGGSLASFDPRIFDAAFRTVNGVDHLVAAHQVGRSGSSTGFARWYDINASTKSLIQSGNAPAGVSGSTQFMPSVNINTAGSIGMTFDESSTTEYWSMYVTERTASDPTGTMEAPVLAKAGTATSPDSRVGDFSATAVDPSDGLTFWSANEYQGSDFWDTHIASFHIAGATPLSGALAAILGLPKAQNPIITPAQTAAAPGATGAATPEIGSQPGPRAVPGVRVFTTRGPDRFWANAVTEDFLALQL